MMKLAIIGLPQAGKSTIFNALTGSSHPLSMSAGRIEVRTEMVNVPDPRLEDLAAFYKSKKIVHAQISFADVAGYGAESGAGLSSQLLNALSGMDGLLLVLRAFEEEAVPHLNGAVDPARDMLQVLDDLLLNDLLTLERKLGRLAEGRQKGGREIAATEREQALFQRLLEGLNTGAHLREQNLAKDELGALAGLGLLTHKPILPVLNLGEGQSEPGLEAAGLPLLALQGQLEMELAQLSPQEALEFLAEYGLEERGAQRVIRAAYELLNTQTFYTVAEKEAHAWMLPQGATALEAAGIVHSDIARGFIRAEVIHAAELLELGSMAKAREAGRLRLEGKDYLMQDGDILNVRFNV